MSQERPPYQNSTNIHWSVIVPKPVGLHKLVISGANACNEKGLAVDVLPEGARMKIDLLNAIGTYICADVLQTILANTSSGN